AVALDAAALALEDLLAAERRCGELALVEGGRGRVEGLDVRDELRDGLSRRGVALVRVAVRAVAAHEALHVAPDRPQDRRVERPDAAVPEVRRRLREAPERGDVARSVEVAHARQARARGLRVVGHGAEVGAGRALGVAGLTGLAVHEERRVAEGLAAL